MKETVKENHSKSLHHQTSTPLDKSLDVNWKSGYYRPYRCDLCNKSYSTAKHRWGHVSVCHRGNPLVTCPICARVFSTCYNLGEHKRTKHGLEEGEIVDVNDGDTAVIDNTPICITSSLKHSTSLTTQHSVANRKTIPAITDNCQKSASNFKTTQTATRGSSLNNSGVLHTCMQCLKVFKTEGELERHSQCHARRVSSDSTSQISNSDVGKKSEFTKSFEVRKKFESVKGSETFRKVDLKAVPGMNNETSLLKQTLLQNREPTEIRSRKRSPSLDIDTDDIKIKKRVGSSAETRSNSGSRRKSSKPRKIARNEEENEDFDQNGKDLNSYACDNCSQIFHTLSELQEHSNTHDEEETDLGSLSNTKPFTCLLCEKDFSLRTSLSRHFNACHGIDPSEVMDISRYQRTSQKKQDAFTLTATGNGHSTSKKFDGQQKISLNQRSGSQNTVEDVIEIDDTLLTERPSEAQSSFICEICTREFGDRASLWLHLRYTHKEYAAYACGICLQICENNTQLYQHWKSSHPPDHNLTEQRRYCCQMCGRQHDCRKKLLTHVSVHNLDNGAGGVYDPEMLVTLNTAFYKFENQDENSVRNGHKAALEQEVLDDGSSSEFANVGNAKEASSYGCELCYKSFPTEDGLVKHKKGAHKVNPSPDASAPSSFRGSYQLYFVCELCGSSHRSKSERWRHVFRAHNGESALTCDKQGCGKVFPTRTLKQEHCTNHHRLQGSTPNVCEICGKLWGTRVDFWKHLMGVHPDCVPLTCGVCLKIFCTVPDLQAHVHSNHMPLTGGDFCCDICGRPYSNRSKLSRHRGIHLIDDPNDVPQVPPLKRPHSLSMNIPEISNHDIFLSVPSVPPVASSKKCVPVMNTVTKSIGKSISFQSHTLTKLGKIPGLSPGVKSAAPKPQPLLFCDACPEITFQCITQLADHRRKIHSLHPCDLCSKFYGRTSHLWKHVKRVHNNHPELTCPICKRISASKAHLENHISMKHYPKNPVPTTKLPLSSLCFTAGKLMKIPTLYPCQKCSKRFWKRHLLKKHQRHCLRAIKPKPLKLAKLKLDSSLSTQNLTCDMCSRAFQTSSRLKEHQKLVHVPQHCEICPDVSFPSKADLFAHIKETHDNHPNFCCPIPSCSRTMRSKSDLDMHHQQHNSVKYPPTCSLCGEVCLNKARLWNHLNSTQHKAAIPLTCGICFKYFPSTEGLIQHIESFHPRALKAPDTCRICAKTYSSVYKVMSHFTKCHPEYYACKDCLQVFKSKAELQEHSEKGHVKANEEDGEGVTGEVEANEETEISGKETITDDLEEEVGIEDDQLACKFFKETFPSSDKLMEHTEAKHQSDVACLISNSGAEKESLNIPGYDIEFNGDAKRQRRSYSCEKCSVVFYSPSDLTEHKKMKHASSASDTKPYHCGQCDRHFSNKSSYWKHINSPAHVAKQIQQKFITATVASQGNHVTGNQHLYTSNVHESTGDSSSAKAQSQVKFDSKVPFVYIPESNLQGNLIKEVKTEFSYMSSISMPVKGSEDKKNNEGNDMTLKSKKAEYKGEHALSRGQASNTSCSVKLSRRRSEVRKVYSDGSDSKSPCYCQLCGKEWPALRHLWQHLIHNHRQEAAVTCGVCLEVCSDYHSLASHLSSVHPDNFSGEGNNFTCRICGRYHNARSKLIQHATIHIVLGAEPEHQPQSNLHNCLTCFRSFTNEQSLHDHQKTHHNSSVNVPNSAIQRKKLEHRCEVCYKVCGNVGALMTHRKSHKMNAEELCTRDHDLVEMETETEEMICDVTNNPGFESEQFYSCDICLKVFKNESLFSKHKQTHVESSKSKNITASCGMKVLIPKIEKQNFYVCDICALVFVTEKSLAAHSESHSVSLSHVSSVPHTQHSSANDISQDSLSPITAESQRTALPKDKFPCTICHITYNTSPLLSTHMEVSHSKHFACSRCKKKTFTSYINLTKHFRICHPKKTQPRSLQASIELLKKWKEHSKDNSVVLSVDSQEPPVSTEQAPEKVKSLSLSGENQNDKPHSSIKEESEELEHNTASQSLGKSLDVESVKNASGNQNIQRCLGKTNSVEVFKEPNGINTESLSMSEYKNKFKDEGSETQERSLCKINHTDSDRSTYNFHNSDSFTEDLEQLKQMEVNESSDLEEETHDVNCLGNNSYLKDQYNIERYPERRNCRRDQSLCDTEISCRLETNMTEYLLKRRNCLDVTVLKVSDSTPKCAEHLRGLEFSSHSSEAPVMKQQDQGAAIIGKHSSVESKFCGATIGKYIIHNSLTCAGVLQESAVQVVGNTDKSNGEEPSESGMGHDTMAEIVGNEILSVEACDFSESNLNSTSGLLSANHESSSQKHVSVGPLNIYKDDFRKTKDCLYSLENALDKLEAQNTE